MNKLKNPKLEARRAKMKKQPLKLVKQLKDFSNVKLKQLIKMNQLAMKLHMDIILDLNDKASAMQYELAMRKHTNKHKR